MSVEVREVEPGRPNVVARIGRDDARTTLLFNGHLDVVPAGDGWTRDPWGASIEGGRLYGRGSSDMKAGCACAMTVMADLASARATTGAVVLTLVIDEEDAGRGTRATIADGIHAEAALICEPTSLKPVRAAKGNCYLAVTVHGRNAHAGAPDDGRNAIHAAAEVIHRVQRLDERLKTQSHPVLSPPRTGVGMIGGGIGVAVVPDRCVVWVDRRTVPGQDGAQALADLRAELAAETWPEGITVTTELAMEMPPLETPSGHPLLAAVDEAMRDAGLETVEAGGWTASCDGGFLQRDAGMPVVIFGPGDLSEAHRPDESIALADLTLATSVYRSLALAVLDGTSPIGAPR